MTPSAPDDEIDAAAYDGLLDALGAEDLRMLAQEFLLDLDRILASFDEMRAAPDGAKLKERAHALTGLLGQYACVRAAALARRVVDLDAPEAALLLDELTGRAARCGLEWRARLAHT
ncbi:MAG: hypothetical protein JWN93_1620 [Hyphomicrobiales bacterium]|jgi:hypothetical protein|nr:hypothetical protein [Hyphomicrobiales bacterium]